MKPLLCLVIALLSCARATADTVDDVLAILGSHPLVRASYEQHKHVPGRKRDLLSSGTLVFARNQGVLLKITAPAEAQLVMSASMIVQRSANQTTRLELRQSPFGAAATVFGQLASGDVQQLQQGFVVTATGSGSTQWELQLTPRAESLRKTLTGLKLSGSDFLREIEIDDTRGGRVLLQLTGHQTQPDTLSADEAELFSLAH